MFPLLHLVKIGVNLENESGVVPGDSIYQDGFAHSILS